MKQILKLKIYCIYNFFKEKKVFFFRKLLVGMIKCSLTFLERAATTYSKKKKKKSVTNYPVVYTQLLHAGFSLKK